ncbi:hypothetical protein RhiirA4_420961 [Rhizophagus irregularis]|uniref:Uncharacterized protein n=1 Tax=Rhizophagus irregularis TaxID=588596 RepID=A0A2I1GJU7_9GLOM|nr:hypothetical protein RhiirA4_420961 [Rhizophagus irregularis]
MSNFNNTPDFHELPFQNHVMYQQLSSPQMTTYNPSCTYGSYPASHFPNFFVISLQNNLSNPHMMITPEPLLASPLLPIPTICRCDPNMHQSRNSFSDQNLHAYQIYPHTYHSYPYQYPMLPTSATHNIMTNQNDEPDVIPLSYQSHQSYYTSAIPAEISVDSQTTLIDKPPNLRNNYTVATNQTLQKKNCKDKNIQFAKSTSNKNRDPDTFDLILKNRRSIIPRKKKTMKSVRFNNYSASGIRKSVENVYPELKNKVWGFFRCESLKRESDDVPGSHKLVAANEPRNITEVNR